MNKIVIYGPTPLEGTVTVSGAKNAALPILAASILAQGWSEISNVPFLKDIETIFDLLSHLGGHIERKGNRVFVNTDSIGHMDAPYDLVKTMRASILVLGPLLARYKRARVSLPGGCAIGERPINLHLDALQKLGAEISLEGGYVMAKTDGLKGTGICFDRETVTGTENIMMAAVLAKGTTVLENCAKEPEVIDLAQFLNKMGAKVSGAGTDTLTIEGVSQLKGTSYTVMPDRIEAGTFLCATAVAGGKVTIKGCPPSYLDAAISKLRTIGLSIEVGESHIMIESDHTYQKTQIQTKPYPGFPTDLQAQMMVVLTRAQGTSVITENIFENRFNHVGELRRMGAHIQIDGRSAIVEGGMALTGAPVMATDLRASASLMIAGLVAKGKTEISRIYHLDRGYENLHLKLSELGARIERGNFTRRTDEETQLPVL